MEQNGINSLISRYIDSVQVLPLEMQSRITEYLQSDLQQRHLLTLAKRTVEDLKTAADDDAKKKHLRQLIYVLVAIQNICDRRISNLDELDEVVETHSLKLMNAKLKVDTTISSQLAASNTENTPESEVDISDQEASDHECNVNLIRRNSTQESSSDKCIVNSSSSNARCNDVNIRGKERFPLRAVSTNNRAASRRSLNKWVSGVHRFKSVTSIISTNIDNALKSHSDFNHRSTKRTSLDLKQHRVGVTYARYSRAQQQRFKSRVLSRPLHSNRTRAPQYLDYAMLRHGPRKRKTVVSKYAHPDSLRNRNETRLVGGVKRRHEHSHSSLYDNDDCFDSPVKPLSELTTEEDKMDERDAYTLLSLKSPRRLGERSSEWNNSYSENETSEDVDCSDNIGHNAYSVNCDQDCPRETQRSRTSTNQLSNVPNSDAGRHKLYRLRRAPNSSAHSNQPHRLNSVVTSVSPEHSTNRGSISTQNNYHSNTRRGCRSSNITRHKSDAQLNARSPPGSPFNYGTHTDDINPFRHKVPSATSPSHSVSEASASPDERLYCICKKVSFGDMIACDNKFCEVEWFHFSCVDVRVQPKGKWYCPYCRGESSKIKRPDI